MRYVITGLLLILGMILFFIFITACAPRAMTRDKHPGDREATVSEQTNFNYDNSEKDDVDDVVNYGYNEKSDKRRRNHPNGMRVKSSINKGLVGKTLLSLSGI